MRATRAALADTDAVLARVRARVGDAPPPSDDDTATALSIADAWAAEVERLVDEHTLAAAAENFRERWPALVRWREGVLGTKGRGRPAHVAAAYESLALECMLAGEHHLSAKAQQAAINAVRRVVSMAKSA
jgi:hypothetical protein